MEVKVFKHQSLIDDVQFAETLQKSGVYEAGYEGVNVEWQGNLYNIAVKEIKSGDDDRVESLFVRIMSRETCWFASFREHETICDSKAAYYNVTQDLYCDPSAITDVLKGTKQARGPLVNHVGVEGDVDHFENYRSECNELIPFRKFLDLNYGYSKKMVSRLLELGLTANPKGVNVVDDSVIWNLSIHYPSKKVDPLLCLKSWNILITCDGRTAKFYSEEKAPFFDIIDTCLKGNQTLEVSYSGKYPSGAEEFFKEHYPTLIEQHGAPEESFLAEKIRLVRAMTGI